MSVYIRVIKNVDGQPVDAPPYYEKPDTARALIAAGIAIEVPRDGQMRINTTNGLSTCDVLDAQGQVIHSSRPAPNAKWQIIPEARKSSDWVQAPYILVSCTSCGNKEVRQGKKAYEPKFKHCPFVTEPKVGNYVKTTLDTCPEAVVKEYKRLYDLWAKENKSASGDYAPEDIYAINWARGQAARDERVERILERQPQYDTDDPRIVPGREITVSSFPPVEHPGTAWANVIKTE